MYGWAEEIGMVFNAGKFELLRFWLDREDAPDILSMAPDGGPIEEKHRLRDLGVRMTTDLTFCEQIDTVVESASRMAGWSLRTFRRRGRGLMLTLLRSLMQPRLDYCSQLWSPSTGWRRYKDSSSPRSGMTPFLTRIIGRNFPF